MKLILSFAGILLVSSLSHSQSGRRAKEIRVQVPPPAQEAPEVNNSKGSSVSDHQGAVVTAERNQDYRCSDDGTLERILDAENSSERILTSKETDSSVVITSKPQPSYTKEARRNGIQGLVAVKVLLSANGKVSRVRIIKGLPAGLTENAIRAACRMKFKPALKNGEPVSQWVTAEYMFRLADSSIFRP